jgi:urease accessory protein
MTADKSWQAKLDLTFRQAGNRTILAERRHIGPLIVQRPFYPEGPICHVYLVHPPGGIVGGDAVSLQVDVEPQAHALLTTQHLAVHDAALEWLPQETIVFDGARARSTTRVELTGEARFLGWEIACLGRPANGETFNAGQLQQDFLLYRDGQPLLLDRMRLSGGSPSLSAPWGLAGNQAMGTLLMYPASISRRCANSPAVMHDMPFRWSMKCWSAVRWPRRPKPCGCCSPRCG